MVETHRSEVLGGQASYSNLARILWYVQKGNEEILSQSPAFLTADGITI